MKADKKENALLKGKVSSQDLIFSVLSEKIKKSFLKKFTKPDGTLYDVLPENGEPDDASKQVRCN